MHDFIVVGAGPAGLQTARLLSERGFDVVVTEEHETVGRPVHCTGILAREAFDEFDLHSDTILNPLNAATFVSPGGRDFIYRPDRVEAVVVDRAAFDARLAESARRAGAQIHCSTRVLDVRCGADFVTIDTSRGCALRARACVLACGARYTLHRPLGLERPALFLHTAQTELPAERMGDVEIHFGAEIAPKGFAWAVPVSRAGGACVRVGVMCARDGLRYFNRMLDRICSHWGCVEATSGPRQKILPLSAVGRTYGDRLIAVGDAAGLVKSTTGGGIYYSLLSATLAAEVLSDALSRNDLGARSLAEYERRWREHLDAELAAQLSLRVLAQGMSDEDIERLFELTLTDGILPIIRRTATFHTHRKLIFALLTYPPARQILMSSMVGHNRATSFRSAG
jgi:geranylgeranyl reductase family protein